MVSLSTSGTRRRLIVTRTKTTKRFLKSYLASVITNGWDWPDGEPCERGSVIFFKGEDNIQEDYIPRLIASGADLPKIRFFTGISVLQKDGQTDETALTVQDIDVIENAIGKTESATGLPVRLVVIDPISNFWGSAKENENAEVRAALNPLAMIAERKETAFLLIQHTGKAIKEHAQQKVLGSTGLMAICRTLWGLYLDKSNLHRFFAPIDTNCCAEPTAVEFIVNREAGGRVEIINASLEKTGDDIEAERQKAFHRGPPADKLTECKAWLTELLENGPQLASVILETGQEEGFSEKTVYRTKKKIGIESKKEPVSKRWMWLLPSQNDPDQGEEGQVSAFEGGQIPIHKQLGPLGPLRNDTLEKCPKPRGSNTQGGQVINEGMTPFEHTLENKGLLHNNTPLNVQGGQVVCVLENLVPLAENGEKNVQNQGGQVSDSNNLGRHLRGPETTSPVSPSSGRKGPKVLDVDTELKRRKEAKQKNEAKNPPEPAPAPKTGLFDGGADR